MAPKRKLDEILAELPSREALDARIQLLQPSSRPPQLHLPSSLDIDSPYALFTLFISEDTIQYISQSTNEYAQSKQASDTSESSESSPSLSRANQKGYESVDSGAFKRKN
jgi:anaphase-promoting complex subunit 8